jgi:hypothetical protein
MGVYCTNRTRNALHTRTLAALKPLLVEADTVLQRA